MNLKDEKNKQTRKRDLKSEIKSAPTKKNKSTVGDLKSLIEQDEI